MGKKAVGRARRTGFFFLGLTTTLINWGYSIATFNSSGTLPCLRHILKILIGAIAREPYLINFVHTPSRQLALFSEMSFNSSFT